MNKIMTFCEMNKKNGCEVCPNRYICEDSTIKTIDNIELKQEIKDLIEVKKKNEKLNKALIIYLDIIKDFMVINFDQIEISKVKGNLNIMLKNQIVTCFDKELFKLKFNSYYVGIDNSVKIIYYKLIKN